MQLFQKSNFTSWRPLCAIARLFIHLYRIVFSPILRHFGTKCLHHPTCSEYGLISFSRYSFGKALIMTISRIRACNPFSGRPYIDYPQDSEFKKYS